MQDQEIKNPSERKYFTILPNLYDDANLTVYEFRLLAHYVRRGNCFESVRTTAKTCRMSHPMVIKSRDSLQTKGYIRTFIQEHQSDGPKMRGTILVEVVDKWGDNINRYESGNVVAHPGHTVSQGGHVVERKKNQTNKNPIPREKSNKQDKPRVRELEGIFQSITHISPEWSSFGKHQETWVKPLLKMDEIAIARNRNVAELIKATYKLMVEKDWGISSPASLLKTFVKVATKPTWEEMNPS